MTILLLLFGLCFAFVMLGWPVAVAIGLASAGAIIFGTDLPMVVLGQRMLAILDSFPFLALPFFVAAGLFMERGGITNRLMDFAGIFVGRMTGGLAQVVIATNVVMAGTSGSATADCVATGTVLIPALDRAGYSRAFAAALTAAASTVGPIVPPSIMFVLYAAITGVSVQRLFLGGLLPAFIMVLYMMVAAYIISRRRGYPKLPPVSPGQALRITLHALPALVLPIVVVGGIIAGVFTPTEAGAIAAVGAFVLGAFVYRELTFRQAGDVLVMTGGITAAVMLIVSAASLFGWLLARERVPDLLAHALLNFTSSPVVFLACVNLLLLVLGVFIEAIPLLILVAPIVTPLIAAYGIDPVHFGVVLVLNLTIGLLLPPVGLLMFIVCTIGNVRMRDYAVEILPFLGVILLTLVLITYVPWLVLALPHLMGR
jgi:C4-dicarboxylate transporter, DctM subunit